MARRRSPSATLIKALSTSSDARTDSYEHISLSRLRVLWFESGLNRNLVHRETMGSMILSYSIATNQASFTSDEDSERTVSRSCRRGRTW